MSLMARGSPVTRAPEKSCHAKHQTGTHVRLEARVSRSKIIEESLINYKSWHSATTLTMFRSIIIVLAIVAATTNAWVVPKNLQKAAATAAVSGALLTAPLVSNAISPPEFDGSYTGKSLLSKIYMCWADCQCFCLSRRFHCFKFIALIVLLSLSVSIRFADPNHPYCLRVIQTPGDSNGKAEISGTDGKCAPDGSGGTDWRVSGKVKGNTLIADFSSKGGYVCWNVRVVSIHQYKLTMLVACLLGQTEKPERKMGRRRNHLVWR